MQRCVQLALAVLASRIWAVIRLGMWLQMLALSVWEKEMESILSSFWISSSPEMPKTAWFSTSVRPYVLYFRSIVAVKLE